jgi:serine/threonine-protein kinase
MATDLAADTIICDRYQVVRTIGRGGMGEVYEVRHLRTKAPLALKILRADGNLSAQIVDRFRREAEITSNLSHPNIVRVFDFDNLVEGRPFLVMELLEGRELTRLLEARIPLPPGEVAPIVEQIALGLTAAHERGIVHRDLKPGNVFLTTVPGSNLEIVKLLDFGISKVRDGVATTTGTDTIMGTPSYMSPEQARGKTGEATDRADQFALAAIAYEMLSGHRAFPGDDPASVLYRVVHERPTELRARVPTLPPALEAVIDRGLAKRPEDRFPSVQAFAGAFARSIGGEEGAAPQEHSAPSEVIEGLDVTTLGQVTPSGVPAPAGRSRIVAVTLAAAAIGVGVFIARGSSRSVALRPQEVTRDPNARSTPPPPRLPPPPSPIAPPQVAAVAETKRPAAVPRRQTRPTARAPIPQPHPATPEPGPSAAPVRNQDL